MSHLYTWVDISLSLISIQAIKLSLYFLCFESLITSAHRSFRASFVSPVAGVVQPHWMHPLISDTIISVDIVEMHCNILLLKDTMKGLKAPLGQAALLIIGVRREKRELLMGKVVPWMSETVIWSIKLHNAIACVVLKITPDRYSDNCLFIMIFRLL